jgi:hypothetical protein
MLCSISHIATTTPLFLSFPLFHVFCLSINNTSKDPNHFTCLLTALLACISSEADSFPPTHELCSVGSVASLTTHTNNQICMQVKPRASTVLYQLQTTINTTLSSKTKHSSSNNFKALKLSFSTNIKFSKSRSGKSRS